MFISQLSESISCYLLSEWSRIVFFFFCLVIVVYESLVWPETVKLPSVLQKNPSGSHKCYGFSEFLSIERSLILQKEKQHIKIVRMLSCHVRLRETLTLTLDPDSFCLRSDAQRNSSTLSVHFMMACLVRSDLFGISTNDIVIHHL